MYLSMHVCMYVFMHVCMYACMYVLADTHTCTYTYTHIHIYTSTYLYLDIYTYMHTHIHICMYIYAYLLYIYTCIYIHIYIYVHMRVYMYIWACITRPRRCFGNSDSSFPTSGQSPYTSDLTPLLWGPCEWLTPTAIARMHSSDGLRGYLQQEGTHGQRGPRKVLRGRSCPSMATGHPADP